MLKVIIAGVVFCLLIHLAAGHSASYIAKDFARGVILLVGGVSAIVCFRMAAQIRKTPDYIYERNRQASLLARKVNKKKELTPEEKMEFDSLMRSGILTHYRTIFSSIKVQLSDRALKEVMHY